MRWVLSTKECSSCLADVPSAALRCKHCFHDFSVKVDHRPGPMIMLWSLAIMSVLGAVVMAFVVKSSISVQYVVDVSTQKIMVKTTTLTGGEQASSIPFDEIVSVEYIEGGDYRYYEVVAMTKDDDRLLLRASDDESLYGFANKTQRVIDESTSHSVELVKKLDRPAEK